jgi:5-methyltetrahydropteroyltriglutamate--homocysteine methyltransferase
VCPGGDRDSIRSAEIDYAGLLHDLSQLSVSRFYLQMTSEPDRRRILDIIHQLLRPERFVFIGVIDSIHPVVETAAQVRQRAHEAASILPIAQLGTTDDYGVASFADDTSTAREIACGEIRA